MLRRVLVLWAAVACGVFAGCGGGGGEGGGGSGTTSSSSSTSSSTVAPPACGDGTVDPDDKCDDGNQVDGDGCSSTCEVEAGYTCTSSPSVCVTTCGDGVVAGEEECDDANMAVGDGCSDTCKREEGYTCDQMPSKCATVCGDGIIAGNEVCDDGNEADGDGCSKDCAVEDGFTCDTAEPSICSSICGDGKVVGTETCDDNNTADGDGCTKDCAAEDGYTCTGAPSKCDTTCNDGIVAGSEQCDDTNLTDGDGCSATCTIEIGYVCNGEPSICATVCNDGIIAGAEACDDGNIVGGDGCSSACVAETGYVCTGAPSSCKTVCGDGIRAGAEVCDDFNVVSGDGCSAACDQVELGWACAGSPSLCTSTCGDGIPVGVESCDDGNTVAGDGCAADCTNETGYACSGAPSVCGPVCGDGVKLPGEKCDDGNTTNGDCCSSTCQLEAGCEIEANDTIATANDFAVLSANNRIKGLISPVGDKDVYLVVIPAGKIGTITAEVKDGPLGTACSNTSLIDTYVTIYSQTGAVLGGDEDSGDGYCSLVTVGSLAPGNYYVEVQDTPNFSSTPPTFDYTLQITIALATCGNGIKETGESCDDGNTANGDGCSSLCKLESVPEVEPNGTCATATGPNLLPPDKLVGGTIQTLTDEDYWMFTLTNFADVRVETFDGNGPGACAAIDTKITAYNSSCTALGAEDDDGSLITGNCSLLDPTVSTQSFMKHLAPGNYYVKVVPYVSSFTPQPVPFNYTMLVSLVSFCGNGILEGSEVCDGTPGCGSDCKPLPVCGNGVIENGEVCDDGNANGGDGCSAACNQIETGYLCTGAPSVCIQPCAAGQTLLQYSATDLPKTIPDNTPAGAVSTINVPVTGLVKRVIIKLDISHLYDADVDITLISPMGTNIDISSDNGSSGDNYTNTVFDDTCPTILNGSPPYTGCYAPEQALSTLNNQQANGNWQLKAVDDAAIINGTLNAWQLTLCVQ